MGHDGLSQNLLLLGLLWPGTLLYGLYGGWLRSRPTTCPITRPPATPIKKRSKEPTPFAGLIHNPLCAAVRVRGRPRDGVSMARRGRDIAPVLLPVVPARGVCHAGSAAGTLCPAQCRRGPDSRRGGGPGGRVTVAARGLGGVRPGEQG